MRTRTSESCALEATLTPTVAGSRLSVAKRDMGSRTDAGWCNSCSKRSVYEDGVVGEARQTRERDGSGNKGVDVELVSKKNGGDVVDSQPALVQMMEQPRRSREGVVQ